MTTEDGGEEQEKRPGQVSKPCSRRVSVVWRGDWRAGQEPLPHSSGTDGAPDKGARNRFRSVTAGA